MRKLIRGSATGLSAVLRKQLRIRVAGNAPHVLSLENDDAGGNAVFLDMFRDSASPQVSDKLGSIAMYGRDAGANKEAYGVFEHSILDPADGSEDSKWTISSKVAGILTTSANFSAGMWMEGATGGDPGAGKFNATEIQVQGSVVPFTKQFLATGITIAGAGGAVTPHGLGVTPKLIMYHFVNVTAEHNYTAGQIAYPGQHPEVAAGNQGVFFRPDATYLNYRFGSNATPCTILNATTGAAVTLTNANWTLSISAWA